MKKYILQYFIPVVALCLLYACKKSDGVTNQPYLAYGTAGTNGQLKINIAYAYTINSANALIKLNGTAVSNLLAGRTPFPGGGFNTNGSNFAIYLAVPTGANAVSVVIPKVGTNVDSIVLYSTTVTIPDNSPYTLHITDTLVSSTVNNTKSVLVKNLIPNIDTGRALYRFVNLMPNVPSVDLYLNGILVKGGAGYLVATDTFSIRTGVNAPGYTPSTTATWAIRPAGAASTTTALATYASASPLASQGVFTAFAMGYSGGLTTRLPFISFTMDKNQ
ncbi:MAG: DUF4397 domain-containing protein [Bacteroidota bacterium]